MPKKQKRKRVFTKPKLAVDRRKTAQSHGELKPRLIVLHSTEGHDREGAKDIEGVLKYLENKGYGVHFCIDKEGFLGQGATIRRIVYHAAGVNSRAIGIEMIGFARFGIAGWLARPRQLRKVAITLAWIHLRTGIPLVRSTTFGVAFHKDFPAGGHHDPGMYPIRRVLRLARKYAKHGWPAE